MLRWGDVRAQLAREIAACKLWKNCCGEDNKEYPNSRAESLGTEVTRMSTKVTSMEQRDSRESEAGERILNQTSL